MSYSELNSEFFLIQEEISVNELKIKGFLYKFEQQKLYIYGSQLIIYDKNS